jgi:hypothetical protein
VCCVRAISFSQENNNIYYGQDRRPKERDRSRKPNWVRTSAFTCSRALSRDRPCPWSWSDHSFTDARARLGCLFVLFHARAPSFGQSLHAERHAACTTETDGEGQFAPDSLTRLNFSVALRLMQAVKAKLGLLIGCGSIPCLACQE